MHFVNYDSPSRFMFTVTFGEWLKIPQSLSISKRNPLILTMALLKTVTFLGRLRYAVKLNAVVEPGLLTVKSESPH